MQKKKKNKKKNFKLYIYAHECLLYTNVSGTSNEVKKMLATTDDFIKLEEENHRLVDQVRLITTNLYIFFETPCHFPSATMYITLVKKIKKNKII